MSTTYTFYAPTYLVEDKITVLLLGAGGTGSEMLDVLTRIHKGLIGLGHPGGLEVTVMDGDTVSPANVGRQRFSHHDINTNKASILVHRYNLFYGLQWTAIPRYLDMTNLNIDLGDYDLVITCVDRAQTRLDIAKYFSRYEGNELWLDLGNGSRSAQCVLGHLCSTIDTPLRLPNVADLFPELSQVEDNEAPSCSMAEALRSQDLMINRLIADCGGDLLWNLLRYGQIQHHGAFVNLDPLSVQPLKIDPEVWAFMGYHTEEEQAA